LADEASQNFENDLNKLVNTIDQSGNMRKDLKKTFYDSISTLRSLFQSMKLTLDEKRMQIKHMEYEVTKVNKELENCRSMTQMDKQRHLETASRRHQE